MAENHRPLFEVLPATPTPAANGQVNLEQFELCKVGSAGSFSFSVVEFGGAGKTLPGVAQTGQVSLDAGGCVVLAEYGGFGADVTVSETGSAAGYHLDHVEVTVNDNGTLTGPTSSAGPSVTEFVAGGPGGGPRGALAKFVNVLSGDQGCSDGYWKQEKHFKSYPAGVLPTDLFSKYFKNAFPGKTLVQVLSTGGGGLIALGRQTVGAFLNAGKLNYPLSKQTVIDEFNAVFPGSDTAYETQKNRFEGFNLLPCPLN